MFGHSDDHHQREREYLSSSHSGSGSFTSKDSIVSRLERHMRILVHFYMISDTRYILRLLAHHTNTKSLRKFQLTYNTSEIKRHNKLKRIVLEVKNEKKKEKKYNKKIL